MVSLRFSSLKDWLWRKDAVRQDHEGGEGSDFKGKKSVRQKTCGKGSWPSQRSSKELQRAASGASSSSSNESQASDWLIGWYEPHGPGFCSDDSFAVLVPCYDSPSPTQMSPYTPPSLSKSQLWADVLTKVAMETGAQADNTRKPSQ